MFYSLHCLHVVSPSGVIFLPPKLLYESFHDGFLSLRQDYRNLHDPCSMFHNVLPFTFFQPEMAGTLCTMYYVGLHFFVVCVCVINTCVCVGVEYLQNAYCNSAANKDSEFWVLSSVVHYITLWYVDLKTSSEAGVMAQTQYMVYLHKWNACTFQHMTYVHGVSCTIHVMELYES